MGRRVLADSPLARVLIERSIDGVPGGPPAGGRGATPRAVVDARHRMLPPDYLAAEARRWICRVSFGSDPAVIAKVRHALLRYYEDLAVVDGIIRFRRCE